MTPPANPPWNQIIAILAAATVLGLAYNQASPLGVRAAKSAPAAVAAAPKKTGFINETVSLTLESSIPMPAPAVAPKAPAALARQVSHLTWAQVKPLLEAGKIVLVDARAKVTYDLGHIPGAVSLPANSTPAEFQAFVKAHPPSTAIVTYCGSESCGASLQTIELLIRMGGYTQASDMPGGYAEFLTANGGPKP